MLKHLELKIHSKIHETLSGGMVWFGLVMPHVDKQFNKTAE